MSGRDPHRVAMMDADTRAVSLGMVPAPPGVVTTFSAVPEPLCLIGCDHRRHPDAQCGMMLADGSVCWCGTPAPIRPECYCYSDDHCDACAVGDPCNCEGCNSPDS